MFKKTPEPKKVEKKPILKAKKVEKVAAPPPKVKSEKDKLLELYQTLIDKNIRSISDLEVMIANCGE